MDSAGFCAFARPSKPRHSCVDLRIERARRGKGNEAKTVLFIQRFAASHCFPRAIHPAAQKKKPSSVKGQGLSRIVVPPHTGYSGHPSISASCNGGNTVRTYLPALSACCSEVIFSAHVLVPVPTNPGSLGRFVRPTVFVIAFHFYKISISIIQKSRNCQGKAK